MSETFWQAADFALFGLLAAGFVKVSHDLGEQDARKGKSRWSCLGTAGGMVFVFLVVDAMLLQLGDRDLMVGVLASFMLGLASAIHGHSSPAHSANPSENAGKL